MTILRNNFIVIIISHGRPNKNYTYRTLRRRGYTGEIKILIDDTDKKSAEYEANFPGEIIIFNKSEIAKTTDQGDNFNNLRTTSHARNACFDVAKKLEKEYFLVLDDDYTGFQYKFNEKFDYCSDYCGNLDTVFENILDFYSNTKSIKSICFAQGGDFIGGKNNLNFGSAPKLRRKCMNSWFCSTKREFKFISRLNEDVNTYLSHGARGDLFFTSNFISLSQIQTQQNSGGMTEAYLESGTYVKTFYSVMYQPSCVKVYYIVDRANPRIHHSVKWRYSVPLILRQDIKKTA